MSAIPSGIVLAGIALVLALVALLPRAEVHHPTVALLRVLFPSWRFFDDLQVTPMLLVRVARDAGGPGAWTPLLPPIPRSPLQLAWNPQGNLRLAQYALLERLLMDVGDMDGDADTDAIAAFVSYQLVLNLVRAEVARDARFAGAVRCQFKLAEQRLWDATDAAAVPPRAGDDLLISREHAA